MDLIARKLPAKGGVNVMALTQLLMGFAKENAGHAILGKQVEAFQKACGEWGKVNGFLMQAAGKRDMLTPLLGATNYLALMGDLVTSYVLLHQATVAWRKLEPLCKEAGIDGTDMAAVIKLAGENAEVRFLLGKVKTAQFFVAHELPNLYAKAASVMSGDQSSMEMLWEADE
ncbi:MAG: acyl-CoA dehydrogenase C-terminal domain-containing protein [Deltaproteobacteria bacterium]|nr:acyl-CoA dehydrogenase C-terminal domain-containing protein [Deltaproteobacteria bacterium]